MNGEEISCWEGGEIDGRQGTRTQTRKGGVRDGEFLARGISGLGTAEFGS